MNKMQAYDKMKAYYRQQKHSDPAWHGTPPRTPLTFEEQEVLSTEVPTDSGCAIGREEIVTLAISNGLPLVGLGICCAILWFLNRSEPVEEQPLDPYQISGNPNDDITEEIRLREEIRLLKRLVWVN